MARMSLFFLLGLLFLSLVSAQTELLLLDDQGLPISQILNKSIIDLENIPLFQLQISNDLVTTWVFQEIRGRVSGSGAWQAVPGFFSSHTASNPARLYKSQADGSFQAFDGSSLSLSNSFDAYMFMARSLSSSSWETFYFFVGANNQAVCLISQQGGTTSPVCLNGGTCTSSYVDSECMCPSRFAGADCSSCATGFAGAGCTTCSSGYFGVNCTACPPCGANGVCLDGVAGTGRCQCSLGFSGTYCHLCAPGFSGEFCDQCTPNSYGPTCTLCPTCGDNGVCSSGKFGNGTCLCQTGWTLGPDSTCSACDFGYYGEFCDACPDCGAHGACSQGAAGDIGGDGSCICDAGWTDGPEGSCSACDAGYFGSPCVPCPDCGAHGTCNDRDGDGQCTCQEGWLSSGGQCNVCAPGYFGPTCQKCPACGAHGTCDDGLLLDLSGTGACICSQGWVSANGGLCNACDEGYFGPSCTPCPTCPKGRCDDGIAGDTGGTGVCICPQGWVSEAGICDACAPGFFGPSCSPCPSCDGHGSCEDGIGGTGICQCNPGWRNFNNRYCSACDMGFFGPNCTACPDCGPNGSCDQGSVGDTGGTGQCICQAGWVSSGSGPCNACAPGFFGSRCTPCPNCGSNGSCDEGLTGDGHCSCLLGWSSNGAALCNVCAANFRGPTCAECAPGFYGPSCTPCPSCLRGSCDDGRLGTGNCTCTGSWSVGTDGQCTNCDGGRTGPNCEECQPGFFGLACQPCQPCGRGSCSSGVSGDGSCTCSTGWAKSSTGLCDVCAPSFFGPNCTACPDCGPNGVCDDGLPNDLGGSGQCSCATGWVSASGGSCNACAPGHFGPTCQLCPDCGPRGSCDEGITQTGTCFCHVGWASRDGGVCNSCRRGFSGSQCNQCVNGIFPDCFMATLCPNGCSGFGACDIRTGVCTCDPRFTGDDCGKCLVVETTFPNCGKATPCPLSCSGHGTCRFSNGTCNCNVGFTSPSCNTCAPGYRNYPECYLVRTCPGSCSGRGTCDDRTGLCTCSGNFGGSACDGCRAGFAYPEDGCVPSFPCPQDCSDQGICNLRNGTCTCTPPYTGTSCENTEYCSSQPCLNGGTCQEGQDRFTCECLEGFGGANCAYITSQPEILSISPLVTPLAGRILVISGNNLQSPLTVIYSVGEATFTLTVDQIAPSSRRRTVVSFEVVLPATNFSGYSTLTFVNPSGNSVVIEGLYVTDICPVEGQYPEDSVCVACPSIGICPGGNRIWPRPGYWNPDEQTAPTACPAPSSRCLGGQGSPCSTGYTGELCAFCSDGYSWNVTSSSCNLCPEDGCEEDTGLPRGSYFLMTFGGVVVLTIMGLAIYKTVMVLRPKKAATPTSLQRRLSRHISVRASRLLSNAGAAEETYAYSPFYSPDQAGDFYAPPGVPMVGSDWRDVYTYTYRTQDQQSDPTLSIDPSFRPTRSAAQEAEAICLDQTFKAIPTKTALNSQITKSTNPDLSLSRIASQIWRKVQKAHQKDILKPDQKGEPSSVADEAEIQKLVDRYIEEIAWRVVGGVNALNKGVFASPTGYYRPFDLPYFVQSAEDKGSKSSLESRTFNQLYANELLGLGISPCISFFGVYSGFNGSTASDYVSRHLHVNLFRNEKFKRDPYAAFHESFLQTNEALNQMPRITRNGAISGCSALVCMLRGNELWLAWAGDCQAVLFRTDGQIISFCDPHVPEREAERERIDRLGGIITNKGIPRVAGVYTVTRAFGCQKHKTLITPEPDVISVDLQGYEQYLVLANEDFWGAVDEDTVSEMLQEAQDTSNIAESLIQYARRMGSPENIAVSVISFTG